MDVTVKRSVIRSVIIVLWLSVIPVIAGTLYDAGYETGDFSEITADPYSGIHKEGPNATVTIVNNPKKDDDNPSDKCVRFRVTQSDERAELRQWRAPGLSEYWYGWQLYLPPDHVPAQSKSEIIQQWHRKGNCARYLRGHPMVLKILANGNYFMTWNYCRKPGHRVQMDHELPISSDADKGRWTHWAFHVKWVEREGQDGFMRLYRNGILVFEHMGPNWELVDDAGYPFYMGGIYNGDPGWTGPSEIVLYQDNHRVGDAKSCLEEVNPFLQARLVFEETFDDASSLDKWIIESQKSPTTVQIKNGKLEWDTADGLTVWFKHALSGNIRIEYDRTIHPDKRAADMNQFWMAREADGSVLRFNRDGDFTKYDDLLLYYAGFGVWNNTKSRFRRYNGKVPRPDPIESTFTVRAGKTYHTTILVADGTTKIWLNDAPMFEFIDPNPYVEGHFGFRAKGSHETINNFRVWQIAKRLR